MYRQLKLESKCKYCKMHINGTTCKVDGRQTSENDDCVFNTMRSVAFTPLIKLSDIKPICSNCEFHHNEFLCEACGRYTDSNDECKCVFGGTLSFRPSQMVVAKALEQAKNR